MTRRTHDHVGGATCSLSGSVVAGSWRTCQIEYIAGPAGVDDTGSLKFVMRYPTDCGAPQFDDPSAANYTTAVASNGARLLLRYDVKDNTRPWGKTIYLKIVRGYLREGERVTLTLGDQISGSPGWRVQTFAQDRFEIRVLVDRYATYVYEPLPESQTPAFRIVAGAPAKLVAIAPTRAAPGEKIVVRSKLEDAWGNPIGRPQRHVFPGFEQPGGYTLSITDEKYKLTAETNPIIVERNPLRGRYWADIHGQTEETIGTNSIDRYFAFARDIGMVDICGHQGNDFQITDEFWSKIQETTRRYNETGRFVTFPGWEWSGNTGLGGDRNIFFREEGGMISRSSRALLDESDSKDPCSPTVEQLFRRLASSGREVMSIPHVGGRFADLDRHRASLEPVIEIHSAWGTFEWMLEDALRQGYRVGVVANSDGHKGRPGASYPGASTFGSYGGLTCVLSDRLDRDAVWEAYQQRRVYGTTGARIFLDVITDDGVEMGGVVKLRTNRSPTIRIRVRGTAALERVELRRGMKVVKTLRTYRSDDVGARLKVLWQGAEVRGRGRQVSWNGHLRLHGNRIAGFDTINFHNLEKRCRRTGPRSLDWESTTTGGVSGVILDLDRPARGRLQVETEQKNFSLHVATLGVNGRSYRCGGLAKQISATPLPPAGGERGLEHEWKVNPSLLQPGDNPLYICVVQEDGQMAWSSPIYFVRR